MKTFIGFVRMSWFTGIGMVGLSVMLVIGIMNVQDTHVGEVLWTPGYDYFGGVYGEGVYLQTRSLWWGIFSTLAALFCVGVSIATFVQYKKKVERGETPTLETLFD